MAWPYNGYDDIFYVEHSMSATVQQVHHSLRDLFFVDFIQSQPTYTWDKTGIISTDKSRISVKEINMLQTLNIF